MSYEIPTCNKCGVEYTLRYDYEPSKYCDECAQVRVIALEAQNDELLAALRNTTNFLSALRLHYRDFDNLGLVETIHHAKTQIDKAEGRE